MRNAMSLLPDAPGRRVWCLLRSPKVSPSGTSQLGGVVSRAAGYEHSLALEKDGSLWIWGSGFRGNLGQGGTAGSITCVPLAVKNETGAGLTSLAPLDVWPNLTQRGLP